MDLVASSKVISLNVIIFFLILRIFVNKPGDLADSPLSDTDLMYFVMTTISTVGYGDISPKSDKAKKVMILFHLTMLIELYAFINMKLST